MLNRFGVYSTLIILISACFLCALLLQWCSAPLAIRSLGRPLPEILLEEFQITNHSAKAFAVSFATMIKTNGNWTWCKSYAPCTGWYLDPHSSHREISPIPTGGERWRLVAVCTRPATRLSVTIEKIFKLVGFRAGWVRTLFVMGPERDLPSRHELLMASREFKHSRMQVHLESLEGIPLIQATAQSGDTDAQFRLGGRYIRGNGVERSVPEALRWFETAATNRHAEAAYNLGTIYEYGLGTSSNQIQASHWYQLASELGHSGAREKLRVFSAPEK